MRVLLLCEPGFGFPYRVLRCIRAARAEAYALGDTGATRLRFSRFCNGVVLSIHGFSGQRDEGLAAEINWYAREVGIDMVLPGGDAASTRALIATKDLIEVPCFPLPGLQEFDLLNNKWEFGKLCAELGITCPATRLLPDAPAVAREAEAGRIAFPVMVKAPSLAGGTGTMKIEAKDAARAIRSIRFGPVLVQEFIEAEDIGASVFCRGGTIEAFVGFARDNYQLRTWEDPRIRNDIAKIVSHLHLDGVYNFDMRRTRDNKIYFLECNPRFFYNMTWLMLVGVNFARLGFPGDGGATSLPSGEKLKLPRGLFRALLKPWTLTRRDWATTRYLLADPAALLIDRFGQR
jgi:predicted ATP-grasp superfamily ATP-dependent carboligase